MIYQKQKKIIDEPLLKTYTKMVCCLCGSRSNDYNGVAGHHVLKRSKLRLDVPWNLYPVCNVDHFVLEHHKDEFIKKWGQEWYDILTDGKKVMEIYEQERT